MPVKVFSKGKVLGRILRRGSVIEGAEKELRRQKNVVSLSATPFACTLEGQVEITRAGRLKEKSWVECSSTDIQG